MFFYGIKNNIYKSYYSILVDLKNFQCYIYKILFYLLKSKMGKYFKIRKILV